MVEQDELLEMLPCSHCKNEKPRLVSCRPEGRIADLWRVECPCEKAPTQWSVSKTAAVRLWNRYMTNMKEELAVFGLQRLGRLIRGEGSLRIRTGCARLLWQGCVREIRENG